MPQTCTLVKVTFTPHQYEGLPPHSFMSIDYMDEDGQFQSALSGLNFVQQDSPHAQQYHWQEFLRRRARHAS